MGLIGPRLGLILHIFKSLGYNAPYLLGIAFEVTRQSLPITLPSGQHAFPSNASSTAKPDKNALRPLLPAPTDEIPTPVMVFNKEDLVNFGHKVYMALSPNLLKPPLFLIHVALMPKLDPKPKPELELEQATRGDHYLLLTSFLLNLKPVRPQSPKPKVCTHDREWALNLRSHHLP